MSGRAASVNRPSARSSGVHPKRLGNRPETGEASKRTVTEATGQALGDTDSGELLREVGLLRSMLEFAVAPGPDEAERLTERAQAAAGRASDAVGFDFFRQSGTIVWSH